MESIALRGTPIIALINFLAGAIIAQQGIFQLRRFGATIFVVDLIGILVLRELGVLLTAIMIAGRSGSAITAELGSMKLQEEIDALTVMGLRPVDILIVPRILALVISLPLLTFIADMAGIFGGLLVSWAYEGITPARFLTVLQEAIVHHTFSSGLIKAPFMGLIIGLIACVEGLAVAGSAESLDGRLPPRWSSRFSWLSWSMGCLPCSSRVSAIDERARLGRRRLRTTARARPARSARNRH